MGWQAWETIGVVILVVGLLTFSRIAPDVVMLGAVTLLLTLGIVSEKDAFVGFANEGMLTSSLLLPREYGKPERWPFWLKGYWGNPSQLLRPRPG
jgi:hypothetical protein